MKQIVQDRLQRHFQLGNVLLLRIQVVALI